MRKKALVNYSPRRLEGWRFVAMRLPIGRGSHRDGGNEEVPREEGAQPQNEEADADQVVAVGINQKVTPRTYAWATQAAPQ